MTRVALISCEHPAVPGGGGIGTYTITTGRALARLGHEVTIITCGDGPPREEEGVLVVPLRHRWLPDPVAERVLARYRTARAARQFGADIAQASEWNAEGWWIARRPSLPLVTRLATPTYLATMLNGNPLPPDVAGVRRMERDQAVRSAALVAPTQVIADRVARDWGLQRERIHVVPNPVDVAAVRAAGAQDPGIALPERFMAFFGRLERRKGLDVLAAGLPRVLDAHPDAHLVLIGDDPGAAGGHALEALRHHTARYADRVHVLGELPRDRALAVVARATLVVLPSRWESFGFVAVEALALGRPVVASGDSGFAEIIEDDRSGWLVPPADEQALADALVERMADTDGLERVQAGALVRAKCFDADRVTARLAEVYADVLAAGVVGGRFTSGIYEAGYRRFFRPEDRSGPFHDLYERKRRAVLRHFEAQPSMAILDVGCGPGRLTAPLAARHLMTGCDISEQMLEEARSRCPDGVLLVRADARDLPFDDGEFDGLVALDLLPHLPDVDAGLQELARVVRPGGPLVFDTSNALPWWVLAYPSYVSRSPRRLLTVLRHGGVLPEWSATVTHHRSGAVRSAIARAGLRVERLERLGPVWTAKWHLWFTEKRPV
jgi:glycogen(starch) synthase